MTAVMLKPSWPGTFHRGTLTFAPGVPVTVDDLQFEAIKGDIGKALVYAKVGDDGIPVGKPARDQSPSGVTVAAQAEQPRRGGRRGR